MEDHLVLLHYPQGYIISQVIVILIKVQCNLLVVQMITMWFKYKVI